MAIDKESSGVPEVDLKRATTKVNLAIIFAAAVFYVITYLLVMRYARNDGPEINQASAPIENASRPAAPSESRQATNDPQSGR